MSRDSRYEQARREYERMQERACNSVADEARENHDFQREREAREAAKRWNEASLNDGMPYLKAR